MPHPVLTGKTALVTGAAVGMGAATAELFARAGAHVLLTDVDSTQGEDTAAAIRDAGGSAVFHRTDVSNATEVADMVQAAVTHFGRLDVAVNNAAIEPDIRPISDFDEDYWQRLMSVDLTGVALCLKYELRQMLAQGDGGSIVNISSISGIRPQPNNPAYVSAKHGVIGLTKTAALENGQHGIRINAVAPGGVDTPMVAAAMEQLGTTKEEYAPKLSLLNRFGAPAEIAEASLWLASEQASFVTGTILPVDAGYTSR